MVQLTLKKQVDIKDKILKKKKNNYFERENKRY